MQRTLSLDVYDYAGHALCNLYDSTNDIIGQAHDVIVHTERNGFKELRFYLPSVCEDEKNYRLDFLISDYRIRFREVKSNKEEIDWFLISESKVTHDAFSTDYEIRAGHISQLLNTKNLNLEFSDTEGNNTGTIGQIAAAILEGTGWHLGIVAEFKEEDKYNPNGKDKVRSFTASSKTGAFKMMNDLCEMFDAKPIYHGYGTYIENGLEKHGRTVDILPINPFSEKLDEGTIPQDLNKEKVIELHYDKSIGNISRTLNTDSLVTVLSAYGSYGDRNGLCSLQKAEHAEITFDTLAAGNYKFVFQKTTYYFSTDIETSNLKWSSIDFTSRSYIFNGVDFFKVYKEPQKDINNEYIEYTLLTVEPIYIKNQVTNITDFSYYQKVNLLTDNMLLEIARAQTSLPEKHLIAEEASTALSDAKQELSRTASSGNGFLLLSVSNAIETTDPITSEKHCQLILNNDSVVYRSDYDEAKRNYFSWNTATSIKSNGRPLGDRGAVIYIIHQGNPTTWEKTYIKSLGNGTDDYYRDTLGNIYTLHIKEYYDNYEVLVVQADKDPDVICVANDTQKMYVWANNAYQEIQTSGYFYGLNEFDEPTTITLWQSNNTWHNGDLVYLFSADSIAGLFGPREDGILSNRESIQESTKVSTEIHPMYFVIDDQQLEPIDACINGYGWCYRSYTNTYNFGDLYFCWGEKEERGWSYVYISYGDENPEKDPIHTTYNYYYSIKRSTLYKKEDGNIYVSVNDPVTVNGTKLNSSFAAVIDGCINQEILTKGVSERYNYDTNDVYNQSILDNGHLPIGNYAFKNEYNNYWLFSTDMVVENLSLLHYMSDDKVVWQDENDKHILKAVEYSFKVLDFPKSNELDNVVFTKMGYSNGEFTPEGDKYVAQINGVHDGTKYEFSLPSESEIVCRTSTGRILTPTTITSSYIVIPDNTTNIRIVCNTDPLADPNNSWYIRVSNYSNIFFSNNKKYTILNCIAAGEKLGITYLMNKFIRLCHDAYEVKLPALKTAQQAITDIYLNLSETLGDMYREGYWQENNYVEGDEDKLYSDAMDNLKEISHPQATYDVKFLDLYGSDDNLGAEVKTEYPDIDTDYAAHLVDMDIDTNKWAYIDKLDKCYDLQWKTKIEINTRLSMIGQQSFTDVLAKIAEVANETKAKQTIYSKASVIGNAGQLAAEKLEGLIQANKIYILGSTSNWYTDAKGNIVFEDVDGNSAMMLTGRGLMIANTKSSDGDWDWRTAMSGKGFNCDVITTGEFSAKHITAGTITVDKLSSGVGSELEIGSNKALTLYATVDGQRPVDGVETKHPNEGDSYIKIAAKDSNHPAYIDIESGGEVNLYGGSSVNIESGGSLNMSGSTVDITATSINSLPNWTTNTKYYQGQLVKNTVNGVVRGFVCITANQDAIFDIDKWDDYDGVGRINIQSGGSIDIKSGAEFLVYSDNFKIEKSNTVGQYNVTIKGNITTTGGKIAGFTIGRDNSNNIDYMYTNSKTSFITPGNGIYIGTNGINIADKLKFSYDGTTASLNVNASSITLGDMSKTLSEILAGIDSSTTTFYCTTDEMTGKSYSKGNTWTCTDTINGKQYFYIYRCKQTRTNATAAQVASDWVLTGTAVTAGAALDIDAASGTINMVAANSINIASGATINVTASKTLSLLAGNASGTNHANPTGSGGSVVIGNSTSPFTIGSDYYTYAQNNKYVRSYIQNGITSIQDSSNQGVYVGTDGFSLRSANYYFKFDAKSDSGAEFKVNASKVDLGDVTLSTKFTNMSNATQAAKDAADGAAATAASKNKVWYCANTAIASKAYATGDIWYETTSGFGYQYVCKQVSETRNNSTDWALVGTSITKGANLKIDAAAGTIDMVAANTITVSASSTVQINSSQALKLTTAGTIQIGNSNSYLFTVAGNSSRAYIQYGGRTSYNSHVKGEEHTPSNTIYIGTDGISLGTTSSTVDNVTTYDIPFKVSSAGYLTAVGVDIKGKLTATSGKIAAFTIQDIGGYSVLYTNGKTSIDNSNDGVFISSNGISLGGEIVNGSSRSKFKITSSGVLTAYSATIYGSIYASGGTIAGWSISGTSIKKSVANTFDAGIDCANDENPAFWAGTANSYNSMEFHVSKTGELYSTSGSIAGWDIRSYTLGKNYSSSGSYDYNVEMGVEGDYVGYWMGSNDAGQSPLAMVMNKNPDAYPNDKAARYSVTAGQYFWSYWNGSQWIYPIFYYKKLRELGLIRGDSRPIESLPDR